MTWEEYKRLEKRRQELAKWQREQETKERRAALKELCKRSNR